MDEGVNDSFRRRRQQLTRLIMKRTGENYTTVLRRVLNMSIADIFAKLKEERELS